MTESRKLWKTIERELLSVRDIETVVLKSHLLVETHLNLALEALFGPSMEKARLSFVQKLELLACAWPPLKKEKSVMGRRSFYENWKNLNKLRNKIAHQLSPENMRTLLIEWVTRSLGYKLKTINRTNVLKRNMIKAIVYELAYFSGCIHEWKDRVNKALKPAASLRC